ncbi:hypothetical protein [Corallococcus sp. 4LFB]|uniref:hypothetical protein n=1 Tax=Corallococcus sp. 4LFB TaxID=3383249 RepID=UPI003975C77C
MKSGIDCLGPALAQGAAVEQEMVMAWNDGNYGTASVAAVLGVANGAQVVSMFLVQGVLDVGNASYNATSGFMEGDYDRARDGSIQLLAAMVLGKMGQSATVMSAELAPINRITSQLAATKTTTTVAAKATAEAAEVFQHGKIYEMTIATSKGPVDMLAEVVVSGKTLTLKDMAIFQRGKEPLTGLLREVLKGKTELVNAAREAGFEQLIIKGIRHPEASTSAKPGKIVEITVDLLK